MTDSVTTTCAYCGVGCGIQAEIIDAKARKVKISGQSDHPANFGRLCSKGISLGDTLGLEGRLLHPEINGQRVSWEQALDEVATRLQQIIADHGPESVAMYLSGQLLTEDYYIANKLMKGFIGSANVDTNSRLCMSSSVAGHKRAFGSDTVPGCYEDLELADLIILTGSNTAWCHPIVFQRIKAAKKQRPTLKVVVIDPRQTATCEIADIHLPLKSGSDDWLFSGLLAYLARMDSIDYEYLEASTEGFGATLKKAKATTPTIMDAARECGLKENDVANFYDLYRKTSKTVTVYSQGINQSSSGTDKVNAIINCHLATGRIGQPGMGPFSLTGQPNAMGGREVGGLANQLAAHMDFSAEDIDRVQRFWQAPNIVDKPGLKAVDLFDSVASGKIRAIWIMGTNPAVSMPDARKIHEALSRCDTVIVSDCIQHTDTTDYANILLPATGWGEKEGTVTNSERCISRQRRLLPSAGEARHDWQIIRDVAIRMGFAGAFDFSSSHAIFKEHAALSGFENSRDARLRDFDISALANISSSDFDTFEPVSWPISSSKPKGMTRLFSDGIFYTPSGKARLVPVEPQNLQTKLSEAFPLVLNTGRIRDQWHTMTRTGLAPQLNQHIAEPYCEVHPKDAALFGLQDQDLASITSSQGEMIARVQISSELQPGNLFIPMHWTAQLSGSGRVGPLVNAITDPVSGQPESKHTPVSVGPFPAQWHGFAYSRRELQVEGIDYWVKIKGKHFYRYELANTAPIRDYSDWCKQLIRADQSIASPEEQWLEYYDQGAGKYRAACYLGDQLISCLFIGPDCQLPDRSWLSQLFNTDSLTQQDRMSLLAGVPMNANAGGGKTICACFAVGESTIRKAISNEQLSTVEAIGDHLNAGTNCGSCIPELQKILAG